MGLEELREECVACRKCAIGGQLVDGNLTNVFSNMNVLAKIMVVGQNPGKDEVQQGEPFVGKSGQFWDKAVKEVVGLDRSAFYISNITRCFTPGNRKPGQKEMDNCRDFLDREIELLKPKLIIALGAPAMKQLTGMSGIMKHRGEVIFSPRYGVNVFVIPHPSPYNTASESGKKAFLEDLHNLKAHLDDNGSQGS